MFKEPTNSNLKRKVETFNDEEEVIIEEIKDDIIINRYRKGKYLGKGGFAKCYELEVLNEVGEPSGISFAGKIVERKSLQKKKTREKFKSEIMIHKSLKHQHIVQFERYFQDENSCYILLELCECNVKFFY
jgi:polo-like kinase 1